MENIFMEDYFNEHVWYDMQEMLSAEILPLGECRWYLADSFLNGVINYFKPISAFVIHRYQEPDQEKREKFNKTFGEKSFHTDLCIGDDVLLLGKSNNTYCFFWFDCDVSDCAIGRFRTEDPEEVVIKRFEEYVQFKNKEMVANYLESEYDEPAWEIPITNINGWVKF